MERSLSKKVFQILAVFVAAIMMFSQVQPEKFIYIQQVAESTSTRFR